MPDETKMTQPSAAPHPSRTWDATCATVIEGSQHALSRWLHDMQTFSGEMSNLAQARTQFALDAWSALAACRGPEDTMDWYRHLATKATEHCCGEIAKCSEMMMKMMLIRPVD
jgi:hypothetical protein